MGSFRKRPYFDEMGYCNRFTSASQTYFRQDNDSGKMGEETDHISWDHVLTLWKHRNATEHGVTPSDSYTLRHERLLKEALFIQSSNPHILAADREWFYTSEETLRSLSASSLIIWIRNSEVLIKQNRIEQRALTSSRHHTPHTST
jgi:hypothetical protein